MSPQGIKIKNFFLVWFYLCDFNLSLVKATEEVRKTNTYTIHI